jgi:acyl-CoA thioester hydrolase
MHLRVRFAETDQMRIAHHSAYVVWCEAARIEWLRERGLRYRDLEDQGVSLAVSSLSLQYRHAARFDDLLQVHATLVEVRSRRVRFAYRMERIEENPTLLATAESVHTPTDADGSAVRLPDAWLAALKQWTVAAGATAGARDTLAASGRTPPHTRKP